MFFHSYAYVLGCIFPLKSLITRMNSSTLVDSSSFGYDNELVLFEDLKINLSTCGLTNKLVHL